MREEVDFKTVDDEHGLRWKHFCSPKHAAQPRKELTGCERLRDVIVGTCFERLYLHMLLANTRKHEYGQSIVLLPQPPTHFDSISIGKKEVDYGHRRRMHFGYLESFPRG
jgi:hypothetical protein